MVDAVAVGRTDAPQGNTEATRMRRRTIRGRFPVVGSLATASVWKPSPTIAVGSPSVIPRPGERDPDTVAGGLIDRPRPAPLREDDTDRAMTPAATGEMQGRTATKATGYRDQGNDHHGWRGGGRESPAGRSARL